MSRYEMLVRVLDGIRSEAATTKYKAKYACSSDEVEAVWQARSRAYIHLYLKVMFGLSSFEIREEYITDGSRDGGIDGYFIDTQSRIVYLLQSKFRNTEDNFESQPIELEEILSMQIKRILSGEDADDQGFKYNGKIKGLQRKLGEIIDLGRYDYKVVIIANIKNVSSDMLLRLTDSVSADILNYEDSYSLLLYPVLSGTLFKAAGLSITVDLSNKSAGAKIGYSVEAGGVDCDITVVFVPTLEIARIMSTYKNSILTYNPRSYLEFLGEKVNDAIKSSIVDTNGNDFALLNNGITVICDESGINEQSGKKHRAQLFLLNPQIINGGQTAYTLSRIYEDTDPSEREQVFAGKEVMVKAIAVEISGSDAQRQNRIDLIEKISGATNNQTPVTIADRSSGDPLSLALQKVLFDKYGILYERKRGEFSEGLRHKYVPSSSIISRTHFARLYLAANVRVSKALKKRVTIHDLPSDAATNLNNLENFMIAKAAFNILGKGKSIVGRQAYVSVLPEVHAAVVVAQKLEGDIATRAREAVRLVARDWQGFVNQSVAKRMKYVRVAVNYSTGEERPELRRSRNGFDAQYERAVSNFFTTPADLDESIATSRDD